MIHILMTTALCSLIPFGPPSTSTTMLLATATADSALAGPGGVTPSAHGGHWGPGAERTVYGQVVEVARAAGADAASLAEAFEAAGSRRVLLVPWDYDSACQPTYWTGSAAWAPAGAEGFYRATPRPESEWVDGVPTLDVFAAEREPYPHGLVVEHDYRGAGAARSEGALTAAELYELYTGLPTAAEVEASAAAALASMLAWEESNAALLARYPGPELVRWTLSTIGGMARRQVLRAIEPPIAGTWRFTFTLDRDPPRTFYARTREAASSAWGAATRADPRSPPERPDGYFVLASGALAPDSLPTDCRVGRRARRESYLGVDDPPPGGGAEWRGTMDARLVARQFPADSALAAFARHWLRGGPADGERATERRSEAGRFLAAADGTLRFEETKVLWDGRTLAVHGERVSGATIRCEW